MVKRFYHLIGLVGLLCMAAGLLTGYIALGQDEQPPAAETTEAAPAAVEVQPTDVPPPTVAVQPTDVPPPTVAVQPTDVPPPTVEVQPTDVPPPTVAVQPTDVPPPTVAPASPVPTEVTAESPAETAPIDAIPVESTQEPAPPVAVASPTAAVVEPMMDAAGQSDAVMAAADAQGGRIFGYLQQLFRSPDWQRISFTLALPDGRVLAAEAGAFDPQVLTDLPAGRYVLDLMLPDGRAEHYEFELQAGQMQALMAAFPAAQPQDMAQVASVSADAAPSTAQAASDVPVTEPEPTVALVVVQPTVVALAASATPMLPTPTPVAVADAAAAANEAPAASVSGAVTGSGLGAAVRLRLIAESGETFEVQPDGAGQFQFGQLPAGAYTLEAVAPGYLPVTLRFGLGAGQVMAVPPTGLVAGDTNGDRVIDLADAALVAANFDGPAHVPAADLNGDGWIDIRDLSVVGRHFGRSGPTNWGQS